MPTPNFDPVEVAALHPEALEQAVTEALDALAKATTLDELKAARLAHAGDHSALALANREIGALPPAARSEAGKRINAARAAARQAHAARLADRTVRVPIYGRAESLNLAAAAAVCLYASARAQRIDG